VPGPDDEASIEAGDTLVEMYRERERMGWTVEYGS
jgi:hypothetical protein